MSEWINVKDRLPGFNQQVLWVYRGHVYSGELGPSDTGLVFYHKDDMTYPDHIANIEWWMPFPEPPEDK